tara:strand:+ start:384 stop:905 length:522 start_codon:yes stop_codon:yes gene_type:complete
MTTLKILTIPDTRLKHKSQVVEKFDHSLKKIIDDMFDTLYASGNGIGLAAPQVGVKKRIVVIDIKKDDVSNPVAYVNPKITKFSDEKFINEEGCLSVPEYFADVERAKEVEVEWFDKDGKKTVSNFSGLMSICIQHEIDHLNGILFIDHLSKLKRKLAIEKLKKIKKNNKTNG